MPAASSSATAAAAFARASAARRADSSTSQRSMSSSASGTPWARYSASTRSYQLQRRRDVAAARGDPAEVVADLGRGQRLADRPRAAPRRAAKSASAARQRAAVDLQHAAVAQQPRLPQRVARRGGTSPAAAGSPPAPRRGARAAAGSPRAAPASAPAPRPPGPAPRARPRPAPRRSSPCSVSASDRLMRASAGAPLQPALRGDRHRAPQVLDRGVRVAELDRRQPERALGRRARLGSSAAAASASRRQPARGAGVGGGEPDGLVGVFEHGATRASLPHSALARHPRDRRGCSYERTARALGPPPGRHQPRHEERRSSCAPARSWPVPGDAPDVAKVLTGWKPAGAPHLRRHRCSRARRRTRTTPRTRSSRRSRACARPPPSRPQGPARVAPNHVLVGEAGDHADRRAARPGRSRLLRARGQAAEDAAAAHHPRAATARACGSRCWTPACSTTSGSTPSRRATGSADVWDVEHDGYADAESGHGTFIAGLILQVAPAAEVYVVKVLDSHGVGDDVDRRDGDGAAAAGHRHRQPLARRLHRQRRRAAGDRVRAERDAQAAQRRSSRRPATRAAPPVLAGGVQAGARGRRGRRARTRTGRRPTSATTAGGSTRPRAA